MSMNILFFGIAIVGVAAVGYIIWTDNKNLRMLKLRVKKLHASPMFAELSPLLKSAQNRPIEELIVDKTGIIIRYMQPAGSESRFMLHERGYNYFSPEKQEAMLLLLEQFLPKITDTNRYSLKKKRIRLLNGHMETYYQYTIHNSYKTTLVRAPYYDGSFQHLW